MSLIFIASVASAVAFGLLVAQVLEYPSHAPRPIINSPIIEFSRYLWIPRESRQLQGPGPNYFSRDNISLDNHGRIHLKAARVDGEWRSAELIATRSLGYGKYSIKVGRLRGPLTDAVTLGFFTWDNSPEEFHREIDIEIHRRIVGGMVSSGAFTVQPWNRPGHLYGLSETPGSEFSFDWGPDRILFEARNADGKIIDAWTFSDSEIPTPGNEKIRINLWLLGGNPPSDEQPIEVVIEEFSFQAREGY